jgi:ariadne-1
MDSDDDFMSAVSSDDDMLPDDSENDDMSGAEG